MLTAIAVGHIDPEMAYWTTSGEFVFVAILSGTGKRRRAVPRRVRPRAPAQLRVRVRAEHLAVGRRRGDAGRHHVPARGPVVRVPAPAPDRVMAAILETEGLTKTFGAVTAAADISVRVEEDTIVGLIGGNGAGKTTFINLVTGYLHPTSGVVRYRGGDITGISSRKLTRLGICRSVPDPPGVRLALRAGEPPGCDRRDGDLGNGRCGSTSAGRKPPRWRARRFSAMA